jgi:uncharacterized protein
MIPESVEKKYQAVRDSLTAMEKVIVAYSGGVDSTLLLRIGSDVLGRNCIGVIGVSPSLAPTELEEAIAIAQSFNGRIDTVETRELEKPQYVSNDTMRCFHCKQELFSTLIAYARDRKIVFILDGNNFDDLGDYRPGMKAARELNVRSPLVEAGMTKEDIRILARYLKLPNWDKPAQPCLSSRMAYGQKIDPDILQMIALAEEFLKQQGFRIVRVRYYGDHVTVEVGRDEVERLLEPAGQKNIRQKFEEFGFHRVEFDREGYHSGKLNRLLAIEK